jgi:hypothetical protein
LLCTPNLNWGCITSVFCRSLQVNNSSTKVLIDTRLKIKIFWDLTLCWVVNHLGFEGSFCFFLQCTGRSRRGSLTSWILKMEATVYSETSVTAYYLTWRHIPRSLKLHRHRCENFVSHKMYVCAYGANFLTSLCHYLAQNSFLQTASQ